MSFFAVKIKLKKITVSKISKITWVMIIGLRFELSLTPEPMFQSYEPCFQDSSLLKIRRIRSWHHEIKDLRDQGWRSKSDNASSMKILKHCSHGRQVTSMSHSWENGWDTMVIFFISLNIQSTCLWSIGCILLWFWMSRFASHNWKWENLLSLKSY